MINRALGLWLCWVAAGLLLLLSWVGLVLLWGTRAGQLVALREAITGHTEVGALLTRALSVWGAGTLLGPSNAGLVHLFRPHKPVQPASAQPALPEQPTQPQLRGVTRRLTLPSPAVKPDPPQDASSELASSGAGGCS